MIGQAPKFTDSEYFEAKPKWRMKPEAPDELKKQFEEYMNSSTLLKRMYPKFDDPYVCWDGEVREKSECEKA